MPTFDRNIERVAADKDGRPKLDALNEVLRKLQEDIASLEGRVGQIQLLNDLRLDGYLEQTERDVPTVSPATAGRIFFNGSQYRVSQSGSSYVPLRPVYVLYTDVTDVGNVAGADTDAMTFSLPADTLAQDGDALHMLAGFTCANNANAGKGASLFLNSTSPFTHGPAAFQNDIITFDTWLIRDGTQIRLFNRSENSDTGAAAAVFQRNDLVAEDPAGDITVLWQVLGSAGASDTVQNFLLAHLWVQ